MIAGLFNLAGTIGLEPITSPTTSRLTADALPIELYPNIERRVPLLLPLQKLKLDGI